MDVKGSFAVAGNILNIFEETIFFGEVVVEAGKIKAVTALSDSAAEGKPYILPGFTDAHVHIESSMVVPSEFAKMAVVHGTVSTISDPHEIANVCGMQGVEFMIENGKTVPFKFNFGAPSCVPATTFETAGAVLNAHDVKQLLQRDDILYLSEMMNFPGVLQGDEEVMKKIKAAQDLGKPVDGHAPGLRPPLSDQYIEAGISTDHECFFYDEALDKLKAGMKILIREGSAAKNFDALIDLMDEHAHMLMFCSDDKHPDSLVAGHINQLCARAVAKGKNVFDVLRAACINPVLHYKTNTGLLRVGDAADFIVAKDLQSFQILETYINGEQVAANGISNIQTTTAIAVNNFNCSEKSIVDFEFHLNRFGNADEENIEQVYVVEALDGQLITNKIKEPITSFNITDDMIETNTEKDLLYMVVVNRYQDAPVSKCFVKNFGLKTGAIASSVAHDSHNIIAVGVDAVSLCHAVNLVIREKGGVSAVSNLHEKVISLPVAGLMSTDDGYNVAEAYSSIDAMAKQMGSGLAAPYMTLSFMGLLVIPHLKLSDMGLFDGDAFQLI
jgi:adenine deaminase